MSELNGPQGHRLLINGVDVAPGHARVEFRELKPGRSVTKVREALADVRDKADKVYFQTGDGRRVVAVGDGLNLDGLKQAKNGIPPVLEFDGQDARFVGADDKVNTWREGIPGGVVATLAVAGGVTYGAGHVAGKYGPQAVALTENGTAIIKQVVGQEKELARNLATVREELSSVTAKLASAIEELGLSRGRAARLEKELAAVNAAVAQIEVPRVPIIGRPGPLQQLHKALEHTKRLTAMASEFKLAEPLAAAEGMAPHAARLIEAADRMTALVGEKSQQIITSLKYMATPLEKTGAVLSEAVAHAPKARGAGLVMAGLAGLAAIGGAVYGHFAGSGPENVARETLPLPAGP